MNTAATMAVFLNVVLYAVFAGADVRAGFWDLTAGGALPGRERRALIEHSIGPVWEANHVWLIFCLVLLWSAFPTAFAAIMTALYVPLGLAALGIVLRGSGFAFRKVAVGTRAQRGSGVAFAASSVLTPSFFGAVAGGIASGRGRRTYQRVGQPHLDVGWNPRRGDLRLPRRRLSHRRGARSRADRA